MWVLTSLVITHRVVGVRTSNDSFILPFFSQNSNDLRFMGRCPKPQQGALPPAPPITLAVRQGQGQGMPCPTPLVYSPYEGGQGLRKWLSATLDNPQRLYSSTVGTISSIAHHFIDSRASTASSDNLYSSIRLFTSSINLS